MIKIVTDDGKVHRTMRDASKHEQKLKRSKEVEPREVIFSGHDENTILVQGVDGKNPDDLDEFSPRDFLLTAPDGSSMTIKPVYSDGCWCFAVKLPEPDAMLPKWKVTHYAEHRSASVGVKVPKGTLVEPT